MQFQAGGGYAWWRQIVLGGWLWMVLGGCGWFQVVLDSFGWFAVLVVMEKRSGERSRLKAEWLKEGGHEI